jgi:alkanesulfonate monooxygenase SsuD/methylene tetrahydromethanopterin reductase-like flavin-dependent oxidoreductase (luciferase family)
MSIMSGTQVGIFDWIDYRSPAELGDLYEQRLQMLAYADTAGFYCYHLAEHHLTSLGGTPSPGVFLAAASQRTRRIRLGALVFILPLYDPVRLAEEICMLDHLTRGRLEVGTGRGISPFERAIQNVSEEASRPVYEEAFELLIEALSTGRIREHHGAHYDKQAFDIVIRPLQQPYPPLWYPAGSVESARQLGEQAINTVTLSENTAEIKGLFDAYKAGLEANRNDPKRLNAHERSPKMGLLRHVYVSDSYERALREARPAYEKHAYSFLYLWERHGQGGQLRFLKDWDASLRQGGVILGTPAQVREQIESQLAATGANYYMPNFSFGDLSAKQVLDSMGLFATEVMPALTAGQ